MWKKKYKNYKVNYVHEERIMLHVRDKKDIIGWQNWKHIRDGRWLMKWKAIRNDSRYKTDKEKDYAWCSLFGLV